MASTNAGFKLSKPVKRQLATLLDPSLRNVYKRAMINAEHSYTQNKHRRPRDNSESK